MHALDMYRHMSVLTSIRIRIHLHMHMSRHMRTLGLDLYYMGWCGGPPGWARLFVKLWSATNDSRYLLVNQIHRPAAATNRRP